MNPLLFFPLILFSLFVTLLVRWGFDRSISVYVSPDAFPDKKENFLDFFAVVDMISIYVTAVFCAFFVGSPVIALGEQYYFGFCAFSAVIIIIISVLRMIRLVDRDYDNKDVITWLLIAVAILPFIITTNFDLLIHTVLPKIIPKTGLSDPKFSQDFLIGIFFLVFGSLIISFLVELFGKLIQKNHGYLFPKIK
jgi:hypothetical protein